MQDPQHAIEKLIDQSIGHQRHGEYRQAYRCIKRALTIISESNVDNELRCRVLIEAARCAYFLTRFPESEQYLAELEALIPASGEPAVRLRCAATIVRANIHRRRSDYETALAVLKAGIGGRGNITPSILVEKLLIEGSCQFYRNEVAGAEEKLEAALGLATHHADPRLRARVLTMMGFLARGKGQLSRAEECLVRAIDLCRAASDSYGEATACLNLGIVRYQSGGFVEAERSISRAHSIFDTIGWRLGVCRCFLALGNVKRYRRDLEHAAVLYEKAGELAQREGFEREKALACEFIGDLHREQGDLGEAERLYRESLRIARRSAPDGDVVIEAYRRLGEIFLSRRSYRESLAFLEQGLTLADKLNERIEKGLILRALGRCLHATGDGVRGRKAFKKAIRLLTLASSRFELALTHFSFAEILLGESEDHDVHAGSAGADGGNDVKKAWKHLIEAGHLLQGMDAPYWRSRVDRLLERSAARLQFFRAFHRPGTRDADLVEIAFVPEFVIFDTLTGVSHAMMHVWQQVQFAAQATCPVLVTGETGTGKELIARLIHTLSERGSNPFIAVNCAAIPDHLFESEFFGHRRGCFTGALADRRGILEEAEGGTLFLDEIGELTPLQQAKLLRVLQESRVRRIGENVERQIDVRIVSATNQDLDHRMATENFRKDFYYRINAEHIHLPALRERPEDIVPLLAYFFCGNGSSKAIPVHVESAALNHLQRYPWPGNVRELFSVLERVRHISAGKVITIDMLPEKITCNQCDYTRPVRECGTGGSTNEETLRRALSLCNGNKAATARWLGISRGTLYKELRRRGLDHLIRQRPSV